MEGRKDDTGKLRYDLIPVYSLERLAEVYTIGAKKYGDRNWEKGLTWSRVFSAMMRHAWAWWRGETFDPVDGQHHLSSVAWCAFALMEYQHKKTGEDDRPGTVVAPIQVDWAAPATLEEKRELVHRQWEDHNQFNPQLHRQWEDHQMERSGFDVVSEFVPCSDCHSHVCIVAGTCTHHWTSGRG